jgi:hypothetical protein
LAGARGNLVKLVAQRIADENKVDINRAKEIIALLSEKAPNNDHYIDNNK